MKLQQIKDVLGRGSISGLTRKLQIKALEWAPVALVGGGMALRATKLQVID